MPRMKWELSRLVDSVANCGMSRSFGTCVMTQNALVYSWDQKNERWAAEVRCCHLHAIEAVTGEPVMMETFEDRERVMRALAA